MAKQLSLVSSLMDGVDYWAPLTVGFQLLGTQVNDQVMWYFDGESIGPSYNLVYNYKFQNSGPHTIRAETGKWIINKWQSDATTDPMTIQISSPPTPNFIKTIDQIESIIIEGESIGISVSLKNITAYNAVWTWQWGDTSPIDGPQRDYSNPSHTYTVLSRCLVRVAVHQYLSGSPEDTWVFPVMVLGTNTPTGGKIDVYNQSLGGEANYFWTGNEVGFSVNTDNNPAMQPIIRDPSIMYLWSLTQFPLGSRAKLFNPNSQNASIVPDVSGSYTVNCNVMVGNITWLRLRRTIYVLSTPSITLNPSQGPVGTGVTVSGNGFPQDVVVWVKLDEDTAINGSGYADGFGQFKTEYPLQIPSLNTKACHITAYDDVGYVKLQTIFQIIPGADSKEKSFSEPKKLRKLP